MKTLDRKLLVLIVGCLIAVIVFLSLTSLNLKNNSHNEFWLVKNSKEQSYYFIVDDWELQNKWNKKAKNSHIWGGTREDIANCGDPDLIEIGEGARSCIKHDKEDNDPYCWCTITVRCHEEKWTVKVNGYVCM